MSAIEGTWIDALDAATAKLALSVTTSGAPSSVANNLAVW